MIALTTIFFAPDWPRQLGVRLGVRWAQAREPAARPRRMGAHACALLAAYLVVQLLLPLRHALHRGDVNWTEEGFRFAWRVMLIEKTGHVELRVRDPRSGREWIELARELTPMQRAMMSTQPDMIAQYARHLAARHRERVHGRVEVYADAWASLNGRPARRLIDPSADLAIPERLLGKRDYILE
jgi:hypothetical protein